MGVNVGVSAYMGLLVFHLRHNLAWSPTQVGAVFSAAGFASLIVAPLVPALSKRFRRGAVVTAGLVVAGLAGPLVGFGRSLWLVAGAWAALAIASGIVNVLLVTLRQQIVPNELLGRVMSSSRFLARLAVPPTMWLAGLGGDAFGAPVVLAAAGAFILLVAAGGAAFGLGRLK
jgi:MFS family permease